MEEVEGEEGIEFQHEFWRGHHQSIHSMLQGVVSKNSSLSPVLTPSVQSIRDFSTLLGTIIHTCGLSYCGG
jgi:hypothetical protein